MPRSGQKKPIKKKPTKAKPKVRKRKLISVSKIPLVGYIVISQDRIDESYYAGNLADELPDIVYLTEDAAKDAMYTRATRELRSARTLYEFASEASYRINSKEFCTIFGKDNEDLDEDELADYSLPRTMTDEQAMKVIELVKRANYGKWPGDLVVRKLVLDPGVPRTRTQQTHTTNDVLPPRNILRLNET
jgi:hypothetical protein